MPDELFVQSFLVRLKALLDLGRLDFAPRSRKTRQFLLDYDLGVDDVWEVLGYLRVGHCYKGPEKDKNGSPGDVMFFRYFYVGIELYIKIMIMTTSAGDCGAVISFHPDGMYNND